MLNMNGAARRMLGLESEVEMRGYCLPMVDGCRREFHELLEKVFHGGSGALELQITDGPARSRWLEILASPHCDAGGGVVAAFAMLRDISKARQSGRETTYLWQAINRAVESVYLINEQLRFIYVNDTACQLLGYSREELLQMGPLDIDPEIKRETAQGMMRKLFDGEYLGNIQTVHRKKSGEVFPVEVSASLFEENGEKCCLAMASNIAERRKVQRNLMLLTFALDRVHEAAFLADEQGRLQYVNAEACRVLGYTRDDLLALPVWEVNPNFSPSTWPGYWADLKYRGSLLFETSHKLHDGRIFPVEVNASYFEYEGQGYDLALVRDITDRKRLQQALATRESEFRTLAENAPNPILRYDRDCRRLYVNPVLIKMSGCQVENLLGSLPTDESMVSASQGQRIMECVKQVVESGRVVEDEVYFTAADGRRFYYLVRYAPEKGADGKVATVLSISTDITERKVMEESLAERERAFRTLVENTPDAIVRYDLNKRRVYFNPAFEAAARRAGLDPAQMRGRTPLEITSGKPEVGHRNAEAIERVIREGQPVEFEVSVEVPSGEIYACHCHFIPEFDGEGRVTSVLNIIRNVTEQRRLEDQLRQSQKMEAIGQLAGGVAHDFNNILAAIIMRTELAELDGGLSEGAAECLQQVRDYAERAANLTRQLLLFSRKQIMQPRDLDLGDVVTDFARMLQRIIGEDVRLQLRLHPVSLVTFADQGMLDQLLMNLAVNARDAMPDGGSLTIETGEELVDDETAQQEEVMPGRYVWLRVMDTGCGIPTAILPHIFEPFYTTKEAGKGTGLGLATVFGIVKQHRGWIKVESTPGQGTRFQVHLPVSNNPTTPETPKGHVTVLRGGSQTILFVEDDEAVRDGTAALLRQFGYHVLLAASGVEALEVWKIHAREVKVLITDIVMPGGMNGQELAAELLRENPQLRVILTSGYSVDLAGKNIDLQAGEAFLQKPFSMRDLLEAIRSTLQAI